MDQEEVVSEVSLDAEISDTIRNTLKDIESREPEVEPVETVRADKPRDPATGKFVEAKETPPSAAPAKADTPSPMAEAASAQAAAVPPTEEAVQAPQGIDLNRAPSSWKPAAKAVWATLPEPVRAEIYRREGDFHNGNKGIRENADFGQVIKNVVEPYRQIFEREGGTPERAIADTLKTAALFRTGSQQEKLNALLSIDKQFGAGLQEAVNQHVAAAVARATGQPAPVQQPVAQPATDPRVDQLLAKYDAQEKAKAAEESRVANAATEKFVSAKDATGQPLYPFVDNVVDDMSARVGILRRTNPGLGHEEILKQAYEAAVWANPETRAVLMSQQQATANQPAEILRKVESAKRASAVNVPKRGAIPATQPVANLRLGTAESDESIRETYRQIQASN